MRRILVVDDEPSILQSARLLLGELGYEVETVSRVEDVLPVLEREEFAAIVQDVRMPGLDLESLVRSVRARPRTARTPIVLYSATRDLAEVCRRLGVEGAVEKPATSAGIVAALGESTP